MWIWAFLVTIVVGSLAPFFFGNPSILRNWLRATSWGVLKLAKIKIEIVGEEYLINPCVFMVNHQSALDIVTIGMAMPKRCVTIAKREVVLIPFIGLIFWASRSIFINRSNRQSAIEQLDVAGEYIRKHSLCVALAPEGTRNEKGEGLLPFKRGGFHLATQAKVPIVPVVCSPLREVANWSERSIRGGKLTITISPPIDTTGYDRDNLDELMGKVRAEMLKSL